MRCFFITLGVYLFAFPVHAVFDLVNLNVIPHGDSTSFCLSLDRSDENLYFAGTQDNRKFFFISPSSTPNQPALTYLTPGVIPPPFQQRTGFATPTETCLGPYPNTALAPLKLFAGVGKSLDDIVAKQSYVQFFEGSPITLPAKPKLWTIMVYMVGSDLESDLSIKKASASEDILEMLQGHSHLAPSTANLVLSTGGSNRDGWRTVKRSVIDQGIKRVISDLGAQEVSAPQSLSDFVFWAQQQFPAEHYALILWNHGDGTGGYGIDTSRPGSPRLSLAQMHQAFQTIRAKQDKPLDIVTYDACLMGSIEVAEVTATLANAMSASADLEPDHGLDYNYLLSNLNSSITNGADFGKLAKTGYFEQAKQKKKYNTSAITYSVYDLTQLNGFTRSFNDFAVEFKSALQKSNYQNYADFSIGLIRAPGYPQKHLLNQKGAGTIHTLDAEKIRLDLYNLFQTIATDFPAFKNHAQTLIKQIDALVVSYDSNLPIINRTINQDAGKITLNIGTQSDHLNVLPQAYTLFKEGLDLYKKRRNNDAFTPGSDFVCPKGLICADAKWLRLMVEDVSSVTAYFGQTHADHTDLHLVKSLYLSTPLAGSLELPTDGKQACRYEVCTDTNQCTGITVTETGDQRIAEIHLNQSPALLTFCQLADNNWSACSVVTQKAGVWGRETELASSDKLAATQLSFESNQLQSQTQPELIVQSMETVKLTQQCDSQKATIVAGYAGLNNREQFDKLCDQGDCLCKPSDFDSGAGKGDDGCKRLGVKSGVFLEVQ